jgi:alkylated DNA repair protein alkB family protein 4
MNEVVQRDRDLAGLPEFDGGRWRPNQANAISYTKARGEYLGAHCDDRQLSGRILCNLSLCCDAAMRYTHDRPDKAGAAPLHARVALPRRSLQIQTGDVRFNYRHEIANRDLGGARRVSFTFRHEKAGGA